jgi:hypothetical protein
LLYGSREQISRRLAELRGDDADNSHTIGAMQAENLSNGGDPDADWAEKMEIRDTLHTLEPPELPQHLSPAQAAEMSELLEYLHNRIRALLESVKFKGPSERITLNFEQWQNLLDVQARLAGYLRSIGDPHDAGEPGS